MSKQFEILEKGKCKQGEWNKFIKELPCSCCGGKKKVQTKPFLTCECILSSEVVKIHLECVEPMKEKPLDLAQVPCWRCIITQHLNLKNKLIKAGLMKKSDTQLPAEYYDGSAIFGSIWDNTPQQVKFINALKELQSTNKSSVPIYKPEAAKPIAKPHERTVFFPQN